MLWHKIQGAGGTGGEPYLTMIAEGQANISTLGGQTGDLLIVCATRALNAVDTNITSTNLTQAVQATDSEQVLVGSGDQQFFQTQYNKAAIFYAIITPGLTSFTLSNHTNYDAYIIRNANGALSSASVFATGTNGNGDITISNATNVAGTVRACAVNAFNTAKWVLQGITINQSIRTLDRDTTYGYEQTVVGERIFGANDNNVCQDCCSIDPQSGTGSLRLDSEQTRAAAAAVFTVS